MSDDNYKEVLILQEQDKLKCSIERSFEKLREYYISKYTDNDQRDLISLLLVTPSGIIHKAFGFSLKFNCAQSDVTAGSDKFPETLYDGFIEEFGLIAKLIWIESFVSYDLGKHCLPGIAYYKETYDDYYHCIINYSDAVEKDSIPFITQSRDIWYDISGKRALTKIKDFIDCINYWRIKAEKDIISFMEWELYDDNDERYSFSKHHKEIFMTKDVIFGEKFLRELKEEPLKSLRRKKK